MDALRAMYRASAAVAEHHDPGTIAILHVPTPVDAALHAEVAAGRVVFVTGNPGDGKTHLIRILRDRLPSNTEVVLDANERANADLVALIDDALASARPLVMAINEGILVELTSAASDRPWAGEVRRKLLQVLRFDEVDEQSDDRLRVLDLNLRSTLGPEVVRSALNRVLALATPCGVCPAEGCRAARNAACLRKTEAIRDRLVDLLDTVGRSGVHATMRDLLGFLAFTVCGDGGACPADAARVDARPYYLNAFEGGLGPLFDAIRRFDPLWRPMPLLDDALWRHTDAVHDWIAENGAELRRAGEEEHTFIRRKRRAFFEHCNGRGDLETAGGEVDLVFREVTDRRRTGPRRLIGLLNRFFDRADAGEDVLHLWTSHRYDARPTRYVATRWHVPALHLRVMVPALSADAAAAFPSFRPGHAILNHHDLSIAEGLIVDRPLLNALLSAGIGGPGARTGEPAARIAAFYDRLARIARRDWLAAPASTQVQLLDMDAGQKVVLGVDVDTGSYVRP